MQTLGFTFPASEPLVASVHVGVVASGDVEILVTEALGTGLADIHLRTSVDGFHTIWRRVLGRALQEGGVEGRYELNDFGATPGMVSLRLAQALELAREARP